MGLPSRIADQKYGTRTSAVAQVDNEEKSPSWFGNPCLRPPELIAQHFAGLHKAQPLQNSNIYLRDRVVEARRFSFLTTPIPFNRLRPTPHVIVGSPFRAKQFGQRITKFFVFLAN